MARITDTRQSNSATHPHARLTMYFLGPPQVFIDGHPATGLRKSQKPLALLAYLVRESDRPHQRGHLAALFWPDHSEKQALQNLRQTLSRLRRALKDTNPASPYILADAHIVQFNRESDYWVDVDVFHQIMETVRQHPHRRLEVCTSCVNLLARAETLYRGEFLAQIHGVESLPFDEWLLLAREQLAYQIRIALYALTEAALSRNDLERARYYARRLHELDPWNEETQRLLLRAIARSEGRNAALWHFRAYVRRLREELDVEPEDATLALVRRIESGELDPGVQPGLAEPGTGVPTLPTTFVGREQERSLLETWLASRDQRLITIYGPGGVGKTRLVLEVARRQVPLWEHGVHFISLAHVSPGHSLAEVLAAALHISPTQPKDVKQQIIGYLRSRELLLILDSFEHLFAGLSDRAASEHLKLIADVLRWAPRVKFLVTSRVRLGLQGEWVLPLQGLTVPDGIPVTPENAETYQALQLFLQRARQVRPDFALTADTLPDAVRICRAVAGLPLGIELAAAWVHRLPVQQIANEVTRNLDFLRAERPDLSPRHHSLRATFEYSYALLSPREQRIFRGLAVFHGSFSASVAQHILDARPEELLLLQDAFLVQVGGEGRLHLHPLVRQYAAEKWQEHPREVAQVQERHAAHYLHLLATLADGLHGEHPQDALDALDADLENIRAAWQWAVEHTRDDLIAPALDGLATFYEVRGLLDEGVRVFHAGAENFAARPDLAGRLRAREARLLARQGRYPQALTAARGAILLCRSSADVLGEVQAQYAAGEALWHQGDLEAARVHLTQALALARRAALPQVEVDILRSLAGVAWRSNDYAQARAHLEAALALNVGNPHTQSGILHNLGVVAIEEGNYTTARRYYEQALALREAIGDRQGAGMTLVNLGNFYLYLGRYQDAERHYRRALPMLEDVGALWARCLALGNLGLVYHYLGQEDLAERYVRHALRLAQEVGDASSEATMWMKLGHILAAQGHFDEAERAYARARELQEQVGHLAQAMESLAGLARVALARGHPQDALRHVDALLAYLEEHTLSGAIDPFLVYWTCYQVLRAAHDRRAAAVLERAYHELQARAARVEDPALRRSFLENVASHREIVTAWEQPSST